MISDFNNKFAMHKDSQNNKYGPDKMTRKENRKTGSIPMETFLFQKKF
jgi:hypothetical protein